MFDYIIGRYLQLWEILTNEEHFGKTRHKSFVLDDSVGFQGHQTVRQGLRHEELGYHGEVLLVFMG